MASSLLKTFSSFSQCSFSVPSVNTKISSMNVWVFGNASKSLIHYLLKFRWHCGESIKSRAKSIHAGGFTVQCNTNWKLHCSAALVSNGIWLYAHCISSNVNWASPTGFPSCSATRSMK